MYTAALHAFSGKSLFLCLTINRIYKYDEKLHCYFNRKALHQQAAVITA